MGGSGKAAEGGNEMGKQCKTVGSKQQKMGGSDREAVRGIRQREGVVGSGRKWQAMGGSGKWEWDWEWEDSGGKWKVVIESGRQW